jgi:hypothetical protein
LINIHAAAPPLLMANLAALFLFLMLLIIMLVFMQVAAGLL